MGVGVTDGVGVGVGVGEGVGDEEGAGVATFLIQTLLEPLRTH